MKYINLQKTKYCLYKPYFFRAQNWYPAGGGEKFGTFPNKIQKFKKPQIKPQKNKKHIYLGIYNSRLKHKILTEMIVEHYLIIAYYIW